IPFPTPGAPHSRPCSPPRIGFAIAQRLAQDGARVVLSSRKQSNVDRAVAELRAQNLTVSGTVCHVGRAEDRERLVATVKRHGGIDILVSNAAVNPFFGSTLDASEDVWNKRSWGSEEWEEGLGVPSDCAGIVSFLCSPDASYITGETVVVGGGAPSRL
uniref:Dehydrogenase/reductase SDR family member 4 n=1 Tax=Gopherus agassizii TaxID=38772 RepID=A0A452GUE1_9SAUR